MKTSARAAPHCFVAKQEAKGRFMKLEVKDGIHVE
jgi:hypothetical protein